MEEYLTPRQQWVFEELLRDPALMYTRCHKLWFERFNMTEPTFSKDWKAAKARFELHQAEVNKRKKELVIETELQAVEMGVLDKLGNMKVLTEIIHDRRQSAADRVKAIDVLNRMQGNYEEDNNQTAAKTLVWNETKKYINGTEL